jgi:hypothetical protein
VDTVHLAIAATTPCGPGRAPAYAPRERLEPRSIASRSFHVVFAVEPSSFTAGRRWRLRYGTNGHRRFQCGNGGRVLGVTVASTVAGAQIVIWDDNGTSDHLWRFI